jgi:hypothetical protein
MSLNLKYCKSHSNRFFFLFIALFVSACSANDNPVDGTDHPADEPESLTITTGQFISGTRGVSYSQTLSAQGGAVPYTWSIATGSLADGLVLNSVTGTISGTPLSDGIFNFSAQVSDSDGSTHQKEFQLTINPEPSGSGCDCAPLEIATGESITVSSVAELVAAVATVNTTGGNRTVLIEDGYYSLTSMLYILADNVMFRSSSGNRSGVTLVGQGMNGNVSHVFLVGGSHITIADISLGEVANHGIQVQGEQGANNLWVHNVRIFNTGEQMIKGSFGNETGSEDGIIECSLFEYTESFGPQYYIGGIDVHQGINWTVSNNTFKNIRSPETAIAEHAIHFWRGSQNLVIDKNIIINCDRGIGLGLGSSGCTGGMIRNNMIYSDDMGLHNDVGIGLESASNFFVYNNTIFFDHGYLNAIEYRFAASVGNEIINNLTNRAITSRDGGSAIVRNNLTAAVSTWFAHSPTGDLHLNENINTVVDAGETLADIEDDIDCETRPKGSSYDIGADEY